MKTIKKLKDNIGKVAGSALLVGATLTAGAAAVTAQDNGSSGDLGDYPAPFVNEDGEVDTTVVVGETAEDGNPVSTADVVSAVEIAGSLGAAAFTEEEVNVDVETTGAVAGWSATNGVTLDRRNSPIFFGQDIDSEENRLDDQDLDLLSDTTFQSEDSEEVTVEHDVRVGTQPQGFDNDRGDVDDPVLHVENPTSPEVGNSDQYLMQAEVDFSDTIDFVEAGTDDSSPAGDADEYIEDGETIEMFGQDFEFSDESTTDELVFYGSSQTFEVGTNDEAQTVTIDGEDHEFDVSYVPTAEDEDATVTVDGDTQGASVGDTINIGDTEVRVTDFYKRSGDEGLGSVEFSIGSDEVTIDSSGDVEVGGDSLDRVQANVITDDDFETVDGIEFAFGAEDSDENMVEAGGMYEDPLFGLQFHYGGLSGDVVENPADVFEVDAEDDDNVEFTFTAGGEETTVQLGESVSDGDGDNQFSFGPEDGEETYAQYEGQLLTEDDRTVLNANEEAGMYEVTSVDDTDLTDFEDDTGSSSDYTDESVSVTIENVVTGETVEVEEEGLDFDAPDSEVSTEGIGNPTTVELTGESIEGKEYDVTFHGEDEVSFERSTESRVQLWPHMYSDSGAAFAIDAPDNLHDSDDNGPTTMDGIDVGEAFDIGTDEYAGSDDSESYDYSGEFDVDITAGYISGKSYSAEVTLVDSSDNTETITVDGDGTTSVSNGQGDLANGDSIQEVIVESAEGEVTTVQVGDKDFDISTGQPTRTADIPSGVASNDATATIDFGAVDHATDASVDQSFVQYSLTTEDGSVDLANGAGDDVRTGDDSHTAVLVTEPEDDNDDEAAYQLAARSADGTGDVQVNYVGQNRQTADMDDEDVEAGYDFYGAYSELDTDDSDVDNFALHLPAGQSSAGLAVTGAEGSLSADGGSSTSSGSAMSQTATGSYADVALDNELEGSDRTDSNLILVGGPSVNSLVGELVDENQTMPASDYTEGEGMIQMVDGFSDDQSALIVAGHSAEDTRAAGAFLADYRNNEAALEGSQVTVSTENGQVVE